MAKEPKMAEDRGKQAAEAVSQGGITFEQLAALIRELKGNDTATADAILKLANAQARTTRTSNAEHPQVSAFSYPEGNVARPKATLNADAWFCGVRQTEEILTPLEIDCFNKITSSKSSRGGTWKAIFDANNGLGKPRLLVTVPVSGADALVGLPSLVQILMELATGKDATDIGSLFSQIEALQKQVEALKVGTAEAVPA